MAATARPRRCEDNRDRLSDGARAAYDEIVARRGALAPPYRLLIESPDVALTVEGLSSQLWHGRLPKDILEAAFLVVAQRLRCHEQRERHEPKALAAGVPWEAIEAIAKGIAPPGRPELRTACLIAKRLVSGHHVGEGLWHEGVTQLGRPALAELCAFIGLATIVATSINLQDASPP